MNSKLNFENVHQNTQVCFHGQPGTKCTINSENVHQNTQVCFHGQPFYYAVYFHLI